MKKKTIIAGSLIGTGLVSFLSVVAAFDYAVVRSPVKKGKYSKNLPPEIKDWIEQQHFEEMTIQSFDGYHLKGHLLKAKESSDRVVICVHGYRSSSFREYARYLKFYHDHGFHILLPDNRAHGESEGRYIGFGWLDRLDCLRWIDTINHYFSHPIQIALHGISMGSATVLMTSGEAMPDNVKCIIADCGYSSMEEEIRHVVKQTVFPNFIATPAILMSKYVAGYDFRDANTVKLVEKSKTPTLFIHGDCDDFVPTRMVYPLYEACHAPKELVIFKGANHARSYVVNPEVYETKVLDFINKYFESYGG